MLQPEAAYSHWLPRGGTNTAVKQFLHAARPDNLAFESRLQALTESPRGHLAPNFDRGGAFESTYDVVVLAYGCESDRKLGVPGEDLVGVLSAREFVGWYNGHPDYVYLTEVLSQRILAEPGTADVAVIGHGNVALDCARVLQAWMPSYHV